MLYNKEKEVDDLMIQFMEEGGRNFGIWSVECLSKRSGNLCSKSAGELCFSLP